MNEENAGNLTDTTVSGDYDADNIQVLEGLEAVRKRPGMYIGSTSERGLHHLVYEIVDNAVDEALAGVCTQIQVSINPDNSITVEDNGRGIPTGINKQQGVSAVELVFCKLHAGGKFGGGGYKVSGGLHGVGASVVNALSTYLEVTIKREGQVHYQKYERGHAACDLTLLGSCGEDEHGSKITFLPDPEIFEVLEFSFNVLQNRLREIIFLHQFRYCMNHPQLEDFDLRHLSVFQDLVHTVPHILDRIAVNRIAQIDRAHIQAVCFHPVRRAGRAALLDAQIRNAARRNFNHNIALLADPPHRLCQKRQIGRQCAVFIPHMQMDHRCAGLITGTDILRNGCRVNQMRRTAHRCDRQKHFMHGRPPWQSGLPSALRRRTAGWREPSSGTFQRYIPRSKPCCPVQRQ